MPRIRHLAIVSPNRERLVNFYTTAFEMRVVYGRPTSTHLSDGDFNLAIVDQKPDLKPGLYVLGFDVDDLAGFGRKPEEGRRLFRSYTDAEGP